MVTKFIAPKVGDSFVILPEWEEKGIKEFGENGHGTITVTDVQIIPDGFIVEGLPFYRDEDDYSVDFRTFKNA